MCGIGGVLSREPLSDSLALAARLSDRLSHRGPDDQGAYRSTDDRLLLVHRRLSIIDPSPAGHQPMATPDGRYWLAFNGEIYNFRALRADLEADGERFTTSADTEVLLRWLVCRGAGSLSSARGMFALALWDAHDRVLLLARDRFGIKPLYVTASPARVAFASEIQALVGSGLVAPDVDPAGVLAYLRWGSIPPPLSWVAGVTSIEPGSWRQWSPDGRETTGRFADVRELWAAGEPVSAVELHERARAALVDSVAAHLVADVRVGVFLSGGIDSAAVVAAARAAGTQLHSYTVVVDDEGYSEAREAQEVADRFETVHHTLHVDARKVSDDWPVILRHLDQPTMDAVNTFYASRAVAATGVKAVLSGVGGDEVFGGYPSFRRLPNAVRATGVLGPLAPLAARTVGLAAGGWRGAKWRHLATSGSRTGEIYRALRGFLMPEEIASIAGPALCDDRSAIERVAAVEEALFAPARQESPSASAARLETTVYLRSQLLRDVDVMSMAHGLEVRVPFVDAALVRSVWPALGAHPDLLARKRLLVEASPLPLPDSVAHAPKRGFTLPFERWMKGDLAEPIQSGLASLAADGWITAAAAGDVSRAWRLGQAHWSRPWGLAVLGHVVRRES